MLSKLTVASALSELAATGWVASPAPPPPPPLRQPGLSGFLFEPPRPPGTPVARKSDNGLHVALWLSTGSEVSGPVDAVEIVARARVGRQLCGYAKGWVFQPRNALVREKTLAKACAHVSEDAATTLDWLLQSYVPARGPLPKLLKATPWLHLEALEVAHACQGAGMGARLVRGALELVQRAFPVGLVSVNAYPLAFANGWAGAQQVSWASHCADVHRLFVGEQARLARFYANVLGAHMAGDSLHLVAGVPPHRTVLHHPGTQKWTLA